MQISRYAAAIAVGLACLAGQASADSALAQVSSVKGSVAVDQGGRIVPLTSATALKAGDRVVSMQDGQAQIRFADGCVIDVRSSAVATVGAKSPCAASPLVKSSTPMQFDEQPWLIPVAFLAVLAVAAVVFVASDNGNEPLSP
jgi:hypothetical protein